MSKFIPWIENPITGTNVLSYSDFVNASSGFTAGTVISSIAVNSGLRQANLVVSALMNIIDTEENLDLNSQLVDIQNKINSYFGDFANKNEVQEDLNQLNTNFTSALNAVQTKVNNIENGTTVVPLANTAATADNATLANRALTADLATNSTKAEQTLTYVDTVNYSYDLTVDSGGKVSNIFTLDSSLDLDNNNIISLRMFVQASTSVVGGGSTRYYINEFGKEYYFDNGVVIKATLGRREELNSLGNVTDSKLTLRVEASGLESTDVNTLKIFGKYVCFLRNSDVDSGSGGSGSGSVS